MIKTKVFVVTVLLIFMAVGAFAAEQVKVGPNLPAFKVGKPPSAEVQNYLGLPNMEPFNLSQIQGKIVIIEIMSAL